MNSKEVIEMSVTTLEDMKGIDLVVIDIVGKSSIADAMIVVTGTSQRHVRSLAESVRLSAKEANHPPLGIEGGDSSDWVLVDLGETSDGGYPSSVLLEDGTVLTAYYANHVESHQRYHMGTIHWQIEELWSE